MNLTTTFFIIILIIILVLIFISLLILNLTLTKNLAEVRGDFTKHLTSSQNTLSNITENLTLIKTTSQQIFESGKDIKSLQDLLKPPKLRGEISELFLEQVLAQVLPSAMYTTQYRFQNGNIVDVAIKLKDSKILCIDAKFPLESIKDYLSSRTANEDNPPTQFIRDVRKHIDTIATKYILPEEETLDFALMYIPAENIYYEIILRDEKISKYARERHVIPVSPLSLYSYLSGIFFAFRGIEIEKNSKQLIQQLDFLKINLENFLLEYDKLGTHLNNAKSKYESSKQLISNTVERLKSIGTQDFEIHK